MKLKNISLLLLVATLNSATPAEIKYTNEEQKIIDNLFNEYKPNLKRCGPAIQEGQDEFVDTLPNSLSFDAHVSCLLSGYRNVLIIQKAMINCVVSDEYMIENNIIDKGIIDKVIIDNIIEFSKPTNQILHKNGISYFYSSTGHEYLDQYIFYTPTGKAYASLLLKLWLLSIVPANLGQRPDTNINIIRNDYITGHLLGYSDADILAFYRHVAKNLKFTAPEEQFEKDRKDSLEWIERNKSNIDQWIEDNSEKYGIQNIDF